MEGMLNYFVPEDGDSSDHLNVVPLPRVEQLRLQHVKKSFPLPGDFHFRFKTAFEGTYVWLDVVNDADPVPDFNGLVICKISRVQRESSTRPPERTEKPKVQAEAPDLIETSEPPQSPTKREEPQAAQKTFNNDLVGLMTDPVPSPTPQAPSAPSPVPPQKSPAPPQAARDPFDVFAGNNTAPMRPSPISANLSANNAPRGMSPTTMGSHGGAYGAQGGFNPMGSGGPSPMAPRGPAGMNISQMHMGMGQPQGGMQQQQQQNSFQGLQWQGMGQQQQQPQQQRNPNQRW
ncbi:hypothetical protein, variant 1 [Phytophthora nicotianae CJ01A1]|uniref:DIX domain-containing protein n=6 Tax=Phytophthora nicotianae TaxID=4792 RepID=W2R8B6_PHYN3|nr:hypothetical protein, variant 1 [Phytophthora nicotianae INRA-310]ETI45749.1 hypothetical protein, variant 1 [Phytophthora nicotianae P1569]ETK85698.1 hypothetical protein, variant 1 [Phytophthora nicotianae]ETO74391.1 hypothetical protein, variant 1 [Phytophthora nicotianae P1976]ETP15572.1 hypothetical protein, variant 1 [Phytophthora nicotianae CJ01A1]ETP43635.1 hypothetical protein, variant 1 [Phytophthora nicotianae P10297]